MSSSPSETPTSSTADAATQTQEDPKAALVELLKTKVDPLLQRIKREYRETVDDGATTDQDPDTEGDALAGASNKKLVPTDAQRKAFADVERSVLGCQVRDWLSGWQCGGLAGCLGN